MENITSITQRKTQEKVMGKNLHLTQNFGKSLEGIAEKILLLSGL